jgi:hypothetical protein
MEDQRWSVTHLSLKPGDTLVVRFDAVVSRESAERINALLRTEIPAGVGLVLLDKGADILVLSTQITPPEGS